MCGRFTLTVPDYASLARGLGVDVDPALAALYRPRYNIAPSDVCFVVQRAAGGGRRIVTARWGLTGGGRDPRRMHINARSETARTTPAFRDAFARRRCVVPTDGFFEWTGPKTRRRALWFRPAAGGLLPLAGLYDAWTDPETGREERAFAILTTGPNDVVAPVHDRMPAVLPLEDVDRWLGDADAALGPVAAAELLRPAAAHALVAQPVSRRVNLVTNDDPGCLVADDEPPSALPLFGPRPRRA